MVYDRMWWFSFFRTKTFSWQTSFLAQIASPAGYDILRIRGPDGCFTELVVLMFFAWRARRSTSMLTCFSQKSFPAFEDELICWFAITTYLPSSADCWWTGTNELCIRTNSSCTPLYVLSIDTMPRLALPGIRGRTYNRSRHSYFLYTSIERWSSCAPHVFYLCMIPGAIFCSY